MQIKKLDVVIIADFCSNFDHKGNNRFIYLANLLIKDGHDVEIVTSNFSHGYKKPFNPIVKEHDGTSVTMLQEKPYKKNVSVKRFFSHYGWGKRVGKYLKERKKPDVVYCAMPTLKAAKEAGKYCKKNNIKFIIDIQDLWPEAYKMVFNIPIISSVIFLPFNYIANSAYRMADEIIAVSQTYVDRATRVNKKIKEGNAVFLGTDLTQFDKYVSEAKLVQKDNVLQVILSNGQTYYKHKDEFWVGYCGSLSDSYDIKLVIDAIKMTNNPKIIFVCMGDGHLKEEFESYGRQNQISQIFTGKLEYPSMCQLLSCVDVVVNPIRGRSAASIINKHGDYAASGKPVINTQQSKEYIRLMQNYEFGFSFDSSQVEEISRTISFLSNNVEECLRLGENGRKCAKLFFDRANTYKRILNVVIR